MPTIGVTIPKFGYLGESFLIVAEGSGFTPSDVTTELPYIYASGLPTGLTIYSPEEAGGLATSLGTADEAGIFNVLIRAASTYGYANFDFEKADFARKIIIEGAGWLAFYHLDWTIPDAPIARNALDLQYNLTTGAFSSATFDPTEGLDLWLGSTVRLHPLIATGRCHSRGTAANLATVSDLRLVARPAGQFDAPPFLLMDTITGTEPMAAPDRDAVDVPYFDLAPGGPRLDRLFAQLNAPAAADAVSAFIACEAQLAFTYQGRSRVTPPFPLRIRQPLTN
ncbi:MAG: hypothetical protein ABMA13_20660 [Chthoniobacteraceae bacterium]